ncbi:MAG: hypothetical protein JSS81_12930 [Acidobacteria bacterium]|nr:hypothetical protein [Acidobacteriota bacterium]
MGIRKQILLAFFIPLLLAAGLLLLRIYVFYDPYDPWIACPNGGVCFAPYEEYEIPKQLQIIELFILFMLVLSLIMPAFVMMRTYQNRRTKLKSPQIFE